MPLLNGNILKFIALITMTIDHIGYILLNDFPPFRIIGRIAFPIFAYMIAEGCRYTKNKKKHFLLIFGLGTAFQLVYFLVEQSLEQSIFITFSLSILIIYSMQYAVHEKEFYKKMTFPLTVGIAYIICQVFPFFFSQYAFSVDYGFWGVLLPVFIYLGDSPQKKLFFAAIGLTFVNLQYGVIQWFSLAALPLLALYDGTKGKWHLKYLFYIYYPLHLCVIWGIKYFILSF